LKAAVVEVMALRRVIADPEVVVHAHAGLVVAGVRGWTLLTWSFERFPDENRANDQVNKVQPLTVHGTDAFDVVTDVVTVVRARVLLLGPRS
jgi:hypothetical protein